MRPTPDELMAAVCRVLEECIAPELSSNYARDELRQVVALLRRQNWNDPTRLVEKDNMRLRRLLRQCDAGLATARLPAGADDGEVGEHDVAPSFETLNNVNHVLRCRLVERLAELEAASGGDRRASARAARMSWLA